MSTPLHDLAQKLDRLDPEADWEQRIAVGEEMKKLLGPKADLFSRCYEDLVGRPAENALRLMGLPAPAKAGERPGAAPAAAARPGATPAPKAEESPADEDPLKKAAAAYRRYRTVSGQAQVNEDELKAASLTWTEARDAFAEGSPERIELRKATDRIDQEIAEAKRRPPQHPNQLAGVLFVPRVKPEEAK